MAPAGPYTFVDSFKMHLAPPSSGARIAPLPAGMRVAAVVADFLKFMRRCVRACMHACKTPLPHSMCALVPPCMQLWAGQPLTCSMRTANLEA